MSEIESVFRAAGDPDAAVKEIKGYLALAILDRVRARKWTHQQAAEATDMPRSEITRVMNGHFTRFTIDRLIAMLTRLDPTVRLKVTITSSAPESDHEVR